ncbi:hypothetical protein DFH05DRAFT_1456556 [Lentinula detonsa]|uniref:Uncharacterized protein n=1 Tax=Lentinula detonsa TaxID=2804962 RepID=A0A9W8P7F6_9AGAR|nr:hypothetical protein DFH05DRAFT_1456556 [Lentinula detonsa]
MITFSSLAFRLALIITVMVEINALPTAPLTGAPVSSFRARGTLDSDRIVLGYLWVSNKEALALNQAHEFVLSTNDVRKIGILVKSEASFALLILDQDTDTRRFCSLFNLYWGSAFSRGLWKCTVTINDKVVEKLAKDGDMAARLKYLNDRRRDLEKTLLFYYTDANESYHDAMNFPIGRLKSDPEKLQVSCVDHTKAKASALVRWDKWAMTDLRFALVPPDDMESFGV